MANGLSAAASSSRPAAARCLHRCAAVLQLVSVCVLLQRAYTEHVSVPPRLSAVFTHGTEGYACFRIPSLVMLPDGNYLALSEGRRNSCGDHGDVDIVAKTSLSLDGSAWSALRVVRSESGSTSTTIGNACPVMLRSGRILLAFSRNNTEAFVIHSDDNGVSWSSSAVPLPVDKLWVWVATGPPAALQLPSGRVIVPIDFHGNPAPQHSSGSFYSDDEGDTWRVSPTSITGGDECQAVAITWGRGNDTVLLSMRSHGPRRLASLSSDGGITWGAPWLTIPETQCEASIMALPSHPSGAPLLVQSSAFSSARERLTLHVSNDTGLTWQPALQIYAGSAAYSSLAPVKGNPGSVALLFEKDLYTEIVFTIATVP
jgi:sialidase-1